MKEALPHGAFENWLDAEFGWTKRTARHFMAVAAWLYEKRKLVSDLHLLPTAAYLLAAKSTPVEAREEALQRAGTGEIITPPVAREILTRAMKDRDARRNQRRVPASRLRPRLARVLQRYGQRCETDSRAELAGQLRAFADALERTEV